MDDRFARRRVPYPVLRGYSLLLRIVGWALIALGCIALLLTIIDAGKVVGAGNAPRGQLPLFIAMMSGMANVYTAFGALLLGFTLVLIGEVARAFVDIALNTRQMAFNTGLLNNGAAIQQTVYDGVQRMTAPVAEGTVIRPPSLLRSFTFKTSHMSGTFLFIIACALLAALLSFLYAWQRYPSLRLMFGSLPTEEDFNACLDKGNTDDYCVANHTLGSQCDGITTDTLFPRTNYDKQTLYVRVTNPSYAERKQCDWDKSRPFMIVRTEARIQDSDSMPLRYYIYYSYQRIPVNSYQDIEAKLVTVLPFDWAYEDMAHSKSARMSYRVVFPPK